MRYTQLIGSVLHLEMAEFLEEQVFLNQLTELIQRPACLQHIFGHEASRVGSRCEQEPSGLLVLSIACQICRQYEDWCTQQEEAQHSWAAQETATRMCMCNPQALPFVLWTA